MVARSPTDQGPLLLADLPPSIGQRRLAIAIIVIFVAAFFATAPFANKPLMRIDAWLPFYATTFLINDIITSVLLFSQYSIVRQRAMLLLAIGYLFSALMVVAHNLSFPGLYSPEGLLGGGLQTAVWIYIVWHIVSPLSLILYTLIKTTNDTERAFERPIRTTIVATVAIVFLTVFAIAWVIVTYADLLPAVYRDRTSLDPIANFFGGVILLLCIIAILLLLKRGRSVLDLWLIVTATGWALEITLQGLILSDRFSLAWYMGRIFSLIASSVVLIVLLSEATTLYAHLARSVMRRRAARQGRQIAMDAMAASIVHEMNQPLGSISLNTEVALIHLASTPPNNAEVRAALEDIANASARGGQVISSLRSVFKKGIQTRTRFEVNNLVREVLGILEIELRSQGVRVSTDLREGLPTLFGDRSQLLQVFLNLIVNAAEAMRPIADRARTLFVTSRYERNSDELIFTIEDSGVGVGGKDLDTIFDPFFTTKTTGMGIGLTICRTIVGAHGGSLRASANKPHGTIFKIAIPSETETGD